MLEDAKVFFMKEFPTGSLPSGECSLPGGRRIGCELEFPVVMRSAAVVRRQLKGKVKFCHSVYLK